MKSKPIKKPRTRKDIENDPRVASIHTEDDGYGNTDEEMERDSYWVYLKSDWVSPAGECGTIHEKTIRACCELIDEAVPYEQWIAEGNYDDYAVEGNPTP
jgi:hypothetical protein